MKESREFSALGVRAHPRHSSQQMDPHGFGLPDYGSGEDHHSPAPPAPGPAQPYPTEPRLRRSSQPRQAYGQAQYDARSFQGGGQTQRTQPLGKQTRAALHGFGAVLSLALMIGSVAWVWQLMQRDVAGVPVVRALEGPLRVAPENPGGRQAAHQGLSVNELAASQEIAESGDIVLAPPAPELSQDDVVPAREAPSQPSIGFNEDQMQPIQVALQQALAAPDLPAEPLGFVSATRRAVESSPRPPRRDADTISSARAVAVAAPAPTDASFAADDLAASVAQSVAAGITSVRDIDVDPASLGPGTRLVQLGAYDDESSARAAWDQLARRFSPLLDERGRVIEAAQSGGSVFYRLRAHGFNDERDARRFCAALVDQQIDCIPVLIR